MVKLLLINHNFTYPRCSVMIANFPGLRTRRHLSGSYTVWGSSGAQCCPPPTSSWAHCSEGDRSQQPSHWTREPMFGMPPPTWGASQGVRGEVERQEVRLSISHPPSRGSRWRMHCHTWTKSSSSSGTSLLKVKRF